ncbi:hypothetical protein, partial [Microbispora tritici]|uniref:hypothetical protein n=1 Tax=Microbispora tritici TaxID=2604471 RepID=UPI001CA36AD5
VGEQRLALLRAANWRAAEPPAPEPRRRGKKAAGKATEEVTEKATGKSTEKAAGKSTEKTERPPKAGRSTRAGRPAG